MIRAACPKCGTECKFREEDAGSPVACAFCGGTFLTMPPPPARSSTAARIVVDLPTEGAAGVDGVEIQLGRSQSFSPAAREMGTPAVPAASHRCPECGGMLAEGVCTICRRSLAVERGKSRTLLILLLVVGGGLALLFLTLLLLHGFSEAGP